MVKLVVGSDGSITVNAYVSPPSDVAAMVVARRRSSESLTTRSVSTTEVNTPSEDMNDAKHVSGESM